ncbi:MAG: hypothetical protein DRQ89_15335 [Epsilonproteobacteria bacterium]|nr:MAG: hypothetical protein DRQ89_15335 [Campylobacterota bacterium]
MNNMHLPKDPKGPSKPSAWRAAFTIACIVVMLLLILFGAGCTMTQTVEINKAEGETCLAEDAAKAQIIIGNTIQCAPKP